MDNVLEGGITVMWVSAVMAILSAVMTTYSTIQSANAQNDALEAQYRQKEKEAKVEQDQIAEQTALDKFEVTREALRAKAAARVSSAESGVLGTTFSRQMLEVDFDELLELGKLDVKHENAVQRGQMELEGMKVKGNTEAASVNLVGAGVQIAGAGVSGYASAGGFRKKKPTVGIGDVSGTKK